MQADITITDLLCTVAHPDDESFGLGSLLAGAVAAGARVVLLCATRGEAGEDATGAGRISEELGAVRQQELAAAAAALGVADVELLGFADSGWNGQPPPGALVSAGDTLVAAVHDALARHRPRVVVTLDPGGSDGHRDHAAIGAATTEALLRYGNGSTSLYHWCLPRSLMDRWVIERGMNAGVYASPNLGRPDGDITTVLDGAAMLEARRAAIAAHASQASPFLDLSPELETAFLTEDHLVRILPPWPGGSCEHHLVGCPRPPEPAQADTAS